MQKSLSIKPLLIVAALLIPSAANADYIYLGRYNSDRLSSLDTYNNSEYERLRSDDVITSYLHDMTLQDHYGNYYDCDFHGYSAR